MILIISSTVLSMVVYQLKFQKDNGYLAKNWVVNTDGGKALA